MLAQIDQPIEACYGDGSYDKWKVYEALEAKGIEPVIPPQHNAKIKQHAIRRVKGISTLSAIDTLLVCSGAQRLTASKEFPHLWQDVCHHADGHVLNA